MRNVLTTYVPVSCSSFAYQNCLCVQNNREFHVDCFGMQSSFVRTSGNLTDSNLTFITINQRSRNPISKYCVYAVHCTCVCFWVKRIFAFSTQCAFHTQICLFRSRSCNMVFSVDSSLIPWYFQIYHTSSKAHHMINSESYLLFSYVVNSVK